MNIQNLLKKYCEELNLEIKLSFKMPKGYKNAYGTYDHVLKTLFLNKNFIKDKVLLFFTFFHELRHAQQYTYPTNFNKKIQKSLNYVINFDGTCFKFCKDKWLSCKLSGSEDYFLRAYTNQPYEIDANSFAFEQCKNLFKDNDFANLKQLYLKRMPIGKFLQADYKRLFDKIDKLAN